MPAAIDFDTRRFQSAAAHYLAGRAPYPDALIRRVADRLHLDTAKRVLDLGCGPAQLATAFAPLVGTVVAMDPEPRMLELARSAAAGHSNVEVVQGGSADLGGHLGIFDAVLIGRAFHWMDRAETLRLLDGLIVPEGAVVLFGDQRPAIPENGWVQGYEALLERWSAEDEDRARRRSDAFLPHISVLLQSAFHDLERIGILWQRELDAADLIERALSQSSTSRARLGERADEMISEIRAEAAGWSRSGQLRETLESNAMLAFR
jgi:SAM-dependent methyltransferase